MRTQVGSHPIIILFYWLDTFLILFSMIFKLYSKYNGLEFKLRPLAYNYPHRARFDFLPIYSTCLMQPARQHSPQKRPALPSTSRARAASYCTCPSLWWGCYPKGSSPSSARAAHNQARFAGCGARTRCSRNARAAQHTSRASPERPEASGQTDSSTRAKQASRASPP